MKTRRLITYKQLKPEKGIPFSRTHLSRLMKAKKFPQQVQVSDNTVAWFEDEIDDHVAEKAATARFTRASAADVRKLTSKTPLR